MRLTRIDSTVTFQDLGTDLEFTDTEALDEVTVRKVRRASVVLEDGVLACVNLSGETPDGNYGVAVITKLDGLPQPQFAFINDLIAAAREAIS